MTNNIRTAEYRDDLLERSDLLDFMFKTISENMAYVFGGLAAFGNSEKQVWLDNNIIASINDSNSKIVIAFDFDYPCGYFQYCKHFDTKVEWREMEISKMHQSDKKTLPSLVLHFLNDDDFKECHIIHGYINGKNVKSQAVFTSMGFQKTENTERGAKYTIIIRDKWWK